MKVRPISAADITASVADALQFISYYHPPDYITALEKAYSKEESGPAKNAMGQLLLNSRMAAFGKRPICQDTGLVVVFVKVGMQLNIDADVSLEDLVNEGVRRAYRNPENPLRGSIVIDPLGLRKNTGDNTPAVVHISLVPGDRMHFTITAKGGGSENKVKFANLNPRSSVSDWVVETVSSLGAGWCPPGLISIGIGGDAEKAMLLAKEALAHPIDIVDLIERGPATPEEKLRLELYERINALGIGAQGLGGMTTVVDVKVSTFPTHAASLPVALVPQCAANRHIEFDLDGGGPAVFTPPDLSLWPEIINDFSIGATRVNLDALTHQEVESWSAGDLLLLSGKLITGRDAAHQRMAHLINEGLPLPVDLAGRVVYYVGPVPSVGSEAVGPAGPTTATRMDPFTELMLSNTGILGMIGKAERGPETIEAISRYRVPYLIAVGGAGYLISKSIKSAKIIAFEDLGMEAIHEFEVQDMPVTVAVDVSGQSIHRTGPENWRVRLAGKATT